jgi:hypothetical protein
MGHKNKTKVNDHGKLRTWNPLMKNVSYPTIIHLSWWIDGLLVQSCHWGLYYSRTHVFEMYNFAFINTPFIGNLISFEWITTNLLRFYLVTYSINPLISPFPYEGTTCLCKGLFQLRINPSSIKLLMIYRIPKKVVGN